ncbi:MAG TPA: SDR family oxidoreductase [Gordonia sp. (in: high G+C Gram-positive bacteria)]|uniref:SDR family oxidoreductase n=1 Tax=unclassified Gordonia (in: high G+C Gram-positive bacteria) TaxID=2657482 RepID=UPI000F96159F|nr:MULTISPECIES: SDR family oxidoreductase [unclassified Gordonia (in: high G+C Gram-positive bacteria)]RUP39898.1 MAG: SDR family oxidoreductase [Gordonia sp. (in: high G+C Gram-positive bacteria)]HNP56748.1 SDR family oxidoreductase [Gordonia sp. (in: high G+C Gram-positive bacteria)]HRC51874.1 SDR family oxidoreductase [Gordonia sp. (in: high G+C Gram-positive bacteria)]
MGKLDGTVALVTGGAGGLGEAAVRALHDEGAAVVIADLADERGERLAAELGDRVAYQRASVLADDEVGAALAAAAALGELRTVVVAHGGWGVAERLVGRDGTPATLEGFSKTLDLYLSGTFNVARLAAAHMAALAPQESGERGAIVTTASIAGYEGQIGQTAYAAAKAGVIGLTIAAARDLSATGIRYNTIAPGTMRTPMMETVGPEALEKFCANVPFPKRLGEPSEFGDTAVFLATNRYVNGEVIRLDGAQRFGPR